MLHMSIGIRPTYPPCLSENAISGDALRRWQPSRWKILNVNNLCAVPCMNSAPAICNYVASLPPQQGSQSKPLSASGKKDRAAHGTAPRYPALTFRSTGCEELAKSFCHRLHRQQLDPIRQVISPASAGRNYGFAEAHLHRLAQAGRKLPYRP
jgi:hypothetical protein